MSLRGFLCLAESLRFLPSCLLDPPLLANGRGTFANLRNRPALPFSVLLGGANLAADLCFYVRVAIGQPQKQCSLPVFRDGFDDYARRFGEGKAPIASGWRRGGRSHKIPINPEKLGERLKRSA